MEGPVLVRRPELSRLRFGGGSVAAPAVTSRSRKRDWGGRREAFWRLGRLLVAAARGVLGLGAMMKPDECDELRLMRMDGSLISASHQGDEVAPGAACATEQASERRLRGSFRKSEQTTELGNAF